MVGFILLVLCRQKPTAHRRNAFSSFFFLSELTNLLDGKSRQCCLAINETWILKLHACNCHKKHTSLFPQMEEDINFAPFWATSSSFSSWDVQLKNNILRFTLFCTPRLFCPVYLSNWNLNNFFFAIGQFSARGPETQIWWMVLNFLRILLLF